MRFWKSRSKNALKKLHTCLPHRLHHCPPPTYSPHSSFAEVYVRHTAQVPPQRQGWGAKKLWEGHNSSRPPWVYEAGDVPFICCSDMSPTNAPCFQPHCSCYRHSGHWALPGTSQWDKGGGHDYKNFFSPILNSRQISLCIQAKQWYFYCRSDYVPQLKNKSMWMQFPHPQTFLPFWKGPAQSCQQGHTQNTAFSCTNKRRTNLWNY